VPLECSPQCRHQVPALPPAHATGKVRARGSRVAQQASAMQHTHAGAGSNPAPAVSTAHRLAPQGHPSTAVWHECTHTHTCSIRGRRSLGRQRDQLWLASAAPPGQGAAVRPAAGSTHARKLTTLPHQAGHQHAGMHQTQVRHCSASIAATRPPSELHTHTRRGAQNTLKHTQHTPS
jgi:hypothetical protein